MCSRDRLHGKHRGACELLKHKLHQQHITCRSSGNGQQHLSLPQMQENHQRNGNQFRQTVTPGEKADVFQAVHNQQPEHGPRQYTTQIVYGFWRGFPGGEEQEGKEPGQHGAQNNDCNGKDSLSQRHIATPPFSNTFFSSSKTPRIAAMAGIMN